MQEARWEYHKAIRHQQHRHWQEWIKNATSDTVYNAWKYASQHPMHTSSSRIPELKTPTGTATSSQDKCNVLHHQFFPPPPPTDLSDTADFKYPEPLNCPPITEHEVTNAINDLSPFKAPGPSGIPNAALQHTSSIMMPLLDVVANASLQLGYHPHSWKNFATVTLRKPGKPDYSVPKAYRPIALEDTMSKVIESVLAHRLTQLAEEFNLIPENHFGA